MSSTDFRKQFESQGQPGTLRPVSSPEESRLAREAAPPPSMPEAALPADERPGAVVFPLNWVARILSYLGIAATFGYVAYATIYGDPDQDLFPVLIGCAIVIVGLCFSPSSIVVDDRGVHQLWMMGLYEYSIAKNSIRCYEESTRARLRREGKLRFEWRSERTDISDEIEDIVYVASKYGRRYILHTNMHRGHFAFIEALEKLGVPPHGYEDWNAYMQDRGVPMDRA